MNRPIQLQKERDFSEKLNISFQFFTQNAKPLLTALLYIVGPVAMIAGIAMGFGQDSLMDLTSNPEKIVEMSRDDPFAIYKSMLTGTYVLGIFCYGIAYLFLYLVVCSYMDIYADSGAKQEITVDMIWEKVKENLLMSIGLQISVLFVVLLGALLLIIPGIYLGIALSIVFMIFIREKLSISDCIRRALYLVKDKWWSTFGLLFVMSFIVGIASMIFGLPAAVLQIMGLVNKMSYSTILTIIATIISTVGGLLFTSLTIIAVNFQYFNLVERKEGTGLLNAIDNIGKNEIVSTEDVY
jgi:hypothetical protein